jgi:excinuclease ABC subunit A
MASSKKGPNFSDSSAFIKIRGARVHNLKNINIDIPKNKLVVITGVSGSGKSSLAFDTIYAEAERRYVESLSTYARQFLGIRDKPDVDYIEGLSPAIAIDQKSVPKNPRSTVGTITEIYDYLRILFARLGKPHCPNCGKQISKQTPSQIADAILAQKDSSKEKLICQILAPVFERKKGEHRAIIEEILHSGFPYVRFDGRIWPTEELLGANIDKKRYHTLEVVIDKFTLEKDIERARVSESVELALKVGKGVLIFLIGDKTFIFSEHFACHNCKINLPSIDAQLFSFNNPKGACIECNGIGSLIKVDPELVIPNKNLTLAEGAIRPWMSASHRVGRQSWYWYQLSELAERYNFSLNTPVSKLPAYIINLILYGEKDGEFEGVIPNLERRWKETDSEFTRQEIEKYMVKVICPACHGMRLKKEALAVLINGKNIAQICSLSVSDALKFFKDYEKGLGKKELEISKLLIKEILNRLGFLLEVGLGYLTLDRESTTLAGGEAQRIRLATQIGSGLCGVIYVLDEPSIGLHIRDLDKLIKTLKRLKDIGNTVIVVEHDESTIRAADWVIDVGPGAGEYGGRIVFSGPPEKLIFSNTLTGEYLSGRKKISNTTYEKISNSSQHKYLEIIGACEHNLKNINVKIPLEKFVCISGVSGSGKSSLITDTLAPALIKHFYNSKVVPGAHKEIRGLEFIDKVVVVDQSPIGRTPRSNPATYTGAFSYIRGLFADTYLAKMRGYTPGRFSFNVKGGRCESCEGQGFKKIEMYFLPDVYIECDECKGRRYNREALEIEWNGKNIAEVLDMTVAEAQIFFKKIPGLSRILKTLDDVGLSYIKLGQPAPTLSGGEAQRLKLATELSRKSTGKTLYILDEPTTGLHFDDIRKLINVLRRLVEQGNSVIVIEHELHVLLSADWIIDLGPEGGEAGGKIVAQGTPLDIAKNSKSYTGRYLKEILKLK